MQLSKTQVQGILDNAPKGVDKKQLLDGLIQRGYNLEGVDSNAIRNNLSQSAQGAAGVQPKPQSFLQDVKGDFLGVGKDILSNSQKRADNITGIRGQMESGQKNDASAIFQTAGQLAGAGADAIGSVFKGAVKLALTPKGEQRTMELVSNFGQEVVERPETQKLINWYEGLAPETQDNLDAVGGFASLASEFVGAGVAKRGATAGLDVASQGVKKVVGSADDALKVGTELRNNIQLSIAKNNVSPQLETSSRRLFLEGTKRVEDPVSTYNRFLDQSKKAVTDTKIDPAISEVGSKMGNAFETVIKQRQAVGKVIGEELKINGKIKINIADTKTNLFAEVSEGRPKFAPDEVSMVDDFMAGVNALGDTPTVSQIDNFVGQTRATLQFTKGKSGVMGTTNAERIINGQIARLRGALDPAVNGNLALAKYWNANKAYSELSDFVEEGSTFLGKKTQSGDYAKDASVAKSSVQSILNQGKKDWMIKLEALTGYKAVDEAVLALQAMKDAGDFRGLSLLQAMSETGLPTTKAGFSQKVIDYAMEKGGKVLAGTPEEQTRAFLQSLKKDITQTTKTQTKATPANTGASTKKIPQSKSSVDVISPKGI